MLSSLTILRRSESDVMCFVVTFQHACFTPWCWWKTCDFVSLTFRRWVLSRSLVRLGRLHSSGHVVVCPAMFGFVGVGVDRFFLQGMTVNVCFCNVISVLVTLGTVCTSWKPKCQLWTSPTQRTQVFGSSRKPTRKLR